MKLLYLSYWSSNDQLTQSIVLPRLFALADLPSVERIYYVTIERGDESDALHRSKISHILFKSKTIFSLHLTKINDLIRLIRKVRDLVTSEKIDCVICNSPLAGAIGYVVRMFLSFKLVIECFEPHADYMLESGVWRRWGLRYNFLRFFEQRQAKKAYRLLTVSDNYTKLLINKGIPKDRIITMPNGVELDEYAFSLESRAAVRKTLGIPGGSIVGIYVGKFGGIYYHDEAFDLFAKAFGFFGERFHMIILTSNDRDDITLNLTSRKIDKRKVYISSVPAMDVPGYLSASDFAFATIKAAPVRKYCCPIKVGEYWANGLPVLLEEGIGDDSNIIKRNGGGFILDMKIPTVTFQKLELFLGTYNRTSDLIQGIARKHRDFNLIRDTYKRLFVISDEERITNEGQRV